MPVFKCHPSTWDWERSYCYQKVSVLIAGSYFLDIGLKLKIVVSHTFPYNTANYEKQIKNMSSYNNVK